MKAVIYTSNTGFTRKYAQMLSEQLSLPAYNAGLGEDKKLLSKGDIKEGMRIIRWAWNSIEQERLEPRYKRKLGYMPMKWSWNAFVVQENVYFSLKALLNRR